MSKSSAPGKGIDQAISETTVRQARGAATAWKQASRRRQPSTPRCPSAGAAGVLPWTVTPDGRAWVLLSHRSPHVQAGGTWSTFGGAIDGGETPWHAAVREASEEIDGIDVRLGVVAAELEVPCEHGCGWTYTTFAVRIQNTEAGHLPTFRVASGHAAWETAGLAWGQPSRFPTIPAFTRGCVPPGRRSETPSAEAAE